MASLQKESPVWLVTFEAVTLMYRLEDPPHNINIYCWGKHAKETESVQADRLLESNQLRAIKNSRLRSPNKAATELRL